MSNLKICSLLLLVAWIAAHPRLDSLPKQTNLLLPQSQHQAGVCYQSSQAKYGPTVSKDGRGITYEASENITHARDPQHIIPGAPVWGKPNIILADGSSCCDNLSEVRNYIDYIDQTIFEYLAIRQQFVVEAGRFKHSKLDLRATPRAIQVIQNAENVAQKNGLAPWIANASWTATLNSFVELELCLFDENVRTKNYSPIKG